MILLSSCAMVPISIGQMGTGSILYVGGSGPGNYTSIQDAIDDASNGDTVFVFDDLSPYRENLVIDKSIILIGENRSSTILDGNGGGNTINISANNVKIAGFTIQNSTPYEICLYMTYGIWIDHSNFVTINENNITNNRRGGICLDGGSNNTIKNNIITKSDYYGIEILGSSNVISDNIIDNSGDDGIMIDDCRDNLIMGNIINNSKNEGIYFSDYSISNTIIGNTITNNFGGIFFGWSMSRDNIIYHNNFINNLAHNAMGSTVNTWYNTKLNEGNYWDDYDEPSEGAYDNNSDGIVDMPYNISGGSNQDLYPLMNLWNEPPVAEFTNTVNGLEVTFDASLSYDFEGEIVSYDWEFGDGTTGTGVIIQHNYINNGDYGVNLTVKDKDGKTDKKSVIVNVNVIGEKTPPVIKITKPERALYMENHKIRRLFLRMALIIGDITVEVNATDSGSGIAKIEFYINGVLKGNDITAPYTYNLTKDKLLRFVHMQIIKVVAYDNAGNSAVAKMILRKFL